MSYSAIICWLCMTTQISRPENTRNTSEKNQQGWSSPSFGVSRLEKIPLCFVNLTDKLETLWALLAGLPASYSPTWTGTGRVCHKHGVPTSPGPTRHRAGAHAAPTGNCGEIPAALTEAGAHLTAPADVGFSSPCYPSGTALACL